ncbi:MAG: hypothetical protein IMZ71_01525 [Chloroflexi bacterium]|nr:hypothetical protein [Chloroflexota bacterium]
MAKYWTRDEIQAELDVFPSLCLADMARQLLAENKRLQADNTLAMELVRATTGLVESIQPLQSENTRLRAMVEAAFREGHYEGERVSSISAEIDWRKSNAKADLDALDNPKAETGSNKCEN